MIELMVAVAIIGIITTLSVPLWVSYRARAARAEVFANLPTLRSLNESYFSDHSTYTDNLLELGFAPMGSPRYIYGFSTNALPVAHSNSTTVGIPPNGFETSRMIDAAGIPLSGADLPTADVTPATYRAGAAANLDNDGGLDTWTLDKLTGMLNVLSDVD